MKVRFVGLLFFYASLINVAFSEADILWKIKQINSDKKSAAIKFNEVGSLNSGDLLVATSSDLKQCDLEVKEIDNSNHVAILDTSKCLFGNEIKVGQEVEKSLIAKNSVITKDIMDERKDEALPINSTKTDSQFSFIQQNSGHIYAGVLLSDTFSMEGTLSSGNTSAGFTSDVELGSPGITLGIDYLPFAYNTFRFGAGFSYDLKRDFDKITTKSGAATATSNTSNAKLKTSSISALIQKEIIDNFSIIAGMGVNFVSISGISSADWELDNSFGVQIGGAFTYNNFRAQLMYKTVSGDLTATQTNSTAKIDGPTTMTIFC